MIPVSTQTIDEIVSESRLFLDIDESKTSLDEVSTRLTTLLRKADFRAFGTKLSKANIWHRARISPPSEKIRDSLFELIYPNTPSKNFGRLNKPGNRVLYAAWNSITALDEVYAKAGGTAWTIHIRPRTNHQVTAILIGALEQVHKSGRFLYPSQKTAEHLHHYLAALDPLDRMRAIYLDSFIAALFREPGNKRYKATSALAEKILAADFTSIIYPSVQTVTAMNLAVRDAVFNQCFEVVSVQRSIIKSSYGYGLYAQGKAEVSNRFSSAGDIDWSASITAPPEYSLELGFTYPDNAPGWVVQN